LPSVRRAAAAQALALPGLAVVALALGLAVFDGGYAGSAWYPVGALALALLVVAWLSAGRLWSLPRPIAVGLGAYAAFCLWSLASLLWAGSPGAALEGATRALLYLVAMTVVAVVPWPAAAARAALVVVVLGAVAIALGTLATLPTDGAALSTTFVDGRLSSPLGYANATASFWGMAFWPALALATGAARTRAARALRPVALAAAGLLAQTALLSQSRGALAAFGLVAVLFVALTPRRGPALLALLALATVTVAAWGTLLEVRSAASAAGLVAAIGDARQVIVLSTLALLVAGAAFDLLTGALPRAARRLGDARLGDGAAIGLAVMAVVVGLAAVGNPASWARARWTDFSSSGYAKIEPTGSRFTGSLGSGRYDYWRVALNEFRAHPVTGIGADNFQAAYLRERRTDEAPRHPHSLAMRLLSQVGIVGTVLFVVFLGAFLVAARRAARANRLAGAALLSAFGVWFVQAQVDWLWAFPALGMLAFALLAVAARLADEPAAGTGPASSAPPAGTAADLPRAAPRRALVAGVVAVALPVALLFVVLAAASRAERRATAEAPRDPRAAVADYELAARLNPLVAEPLVTGAVLARRLGDPARAGRLLRRALAREPGNWFGQLEVALLDATAGRRADALAHLDRARELNPRQPVIARTADAIRRGTPIDPDAVESELSRQREARLVPVGGA
jgi:tetratricopeptide (TPR) repeat protein